MVMYRRALARGGGTCRPTSFPGDRTIERTYDPTNAPKHGEEPRDALENPGRKSLIFSWTIGPHDAAIAAGAPSGEVATGLELRPGMQGLVRAAPMECGSPADIDRLAGQLRERKPSRTPSAHERDLPAPRMRHGGRVRIRIPTGDRGAGPRRRRSVRRSPPSGRDPFRELRAGQRRVPHVLALSGT
jgi:uncharacterized protein with GYD domain